MAAGRRALEIIRAESNPDMLVELEVDAGGSYSWITAYDGNTIFDGDITIDGSGDDLIFNPVTGNVEITASNSQAGDISVRGIRIKRSSVPQGALYPETTFTPITVTEGSTLRFTEIKLTLT